MKKLRKEVLLYMFHKCVIFDQIYDKSRQRNLSYRKTIPHTTTNICIIQCTDISRDSADTRLCTSSCVCVCILHVDRIKFMRGIFRQYLFVNV